MKAIVNGRILLPGAEVQGKALVYDKKIVGVMDEAAARMKSSTRRGCM